MAHGTARAAATACLGLIALQAAASKGGSGRIASLMQDVNGILQHALDPNVPAIPDLRNGGTWGATSGPVAGTPYARPAGTAAGAARSPVYTGGGPGRRAI